MIYVLHHYRAGKVLLHFVDSATMLQKLNELQVEDMCRQLGIDYKLGRDDEHMTIVCAHPSLIKPWEPPCPA